MKSYNRTLITVYKTQAFLDWVISIHSHLHRLTLLDVNAKPHAYMIEIEDVNDEVADVALSKHCVKIIENELVFQFIPQEKWPIKMDFTLFRNWFNYQYHEGLFDLLTEELKIYDE